MHDNLSGTRVALDLRRMWKTGIGRYSRSLLTALSTVAPSIEFFAVVNSEQDESYLSSAMPSVSTIVSPAKQYSLTEMASLPKLGQPFDLWHSPHPYQLGIGARTPVVLSILDLIQVHHAIGVRNWLARYPIRELLRMSTRRARHLIAISDSTAKAFIAEFALSPEKVSITPLAADERLPTDISEADTSLLRQRTGILGPFILFVGMLQPHKNVFGLLDAISISEPRLQHTLLVVGQFAPDAVARLRTYADSKGIGERLRILANATDRELAAAYRAADLLVLPSFQEGFGLPLVEAMRFGTPCATSSLSVMREVAGDAAHYFDPHDVMDMSHVILRLLADEKLRRELSLAGRRRSARYNWLRTAESTIAAYRKTLRLSL